MASITIWIEIVPMAKSFIVIQSRMGCLNPRFRAEYFPRSLKILVTF